MADKPLAPLPSADVTVRDATLADVAFIDALQKRHADRVGFMRASWIEEKIRAGQVLVAEEVRGQKSEVSEDGGDAPRLTSDLRPLTSGSPVGYCMGVDRYFKRDDVGIIHQLNVAPGHQRGFVGATLLRAMFDRAAYGCRLFCCWCAQDIEANRFWEAMGFVPLAYRAGSEKKRRVHIFWQKRIRENDRETPWWFPAKTDGGVIRADRIVLPIPPGRHWSEEMPILMPAEQAPQAERPKRVKKPLPLTPPPKGPATAPRQFAGPPSKPTPAPAPVATPVVPEKPKQGGREKKPKVKADPKLVAVARELRDRWLEQVNSGGAEQYVLEGAGKYDVVRITHVDPQNALTLPARGQSPIPLASPGGRGKLLPAA